MLLSSLSTASRYLATAAVSTEKFPSPMAASRLQAGVHLRRDCGMPRRGPRTTCLNCGSPPGPSLCFGPDKGLKHTLYVSPVWGRLCNSVARRCLVAGLRYDFYSSIARLCEFLRKLRICSRRTAGSLLYTFDLRQEPSELLVVEV